MPPPEAIDRPDDGKPSPSSDGNQTGADRDSRGHFKPGNRHGRGRARGSRNVASRLLEAVSADDFQAVIATVVARARGGDMVAARMLLDRLAPPPRGRCVAFALPDVKSAQPAILLAHVLRAVAIGQITTGEARDIADVIGALERARRQGADDEGSDSGVKLPEGTKLRFTLDLGERDDVAESVAAASYSPQTDCT